MIDRIPLATAFILAGLILLIIGSLPPLSKKKEQELQELNRIIAETYGGK